jgi:putative spermidine/putrescine transport system substrate-binding protein
MDRFKRSVDRRTVVAVFTLALAGALTLAGMEPVPAQQKYAGQTLRLQTWGGQEGAMIRKFVSEPFEKMTGAKVVVEEGWTSASVAKLQAQKADPKMDVVLFDDIGVVQASREGLLDPIDFSKIPNARDIPAEYILEKDKGIGIFRYLVAVAYFTEAFKSPPDSWTVLWDPRLKGKVILPALDGTSIHKILMIAALVHGGSQANVEPGIQALMKLKPNVHSLQKNTGFIAEALRTGDAALVTWQPNQLKEYIEKGYPIRTTVNLKEGIFATPGCASIVKGHNAPTELINTFINIALSPEAQLGFIKDFWQSPTNRKVVLPDEAKRFVQPAEGSAVKNIPVDLEAFHAAKAQNLEKLNKVFLQ